MTIQEAYENMNALEEFFCKAYSDVHKRFLFKKLQRYSNNRMKKGIDYLCENNKFTPSPAEIIAAVRKSTVKQADVEKVECKECLNTGLRMYTHIINGIKYEQACRCTCLNAEQWEYDGTKCEDYPTDYYIPSYDQIFQGGN